MPGEDTTGFLFMYVVDDWCVLVEGQCASMKGKCIIHNKIFFLLSKC